MMALQRIEAASVKVEVEMASDSKQALYFNQVRLRWLMINDKHHMAPSS